MSATQARLLLLAGLAVFLASLDGSALFLALPALGAEFHARVPDLANLGSVIALGSLGALPLGMLVDAFGRRRLIALAVAGFAAADLVSGLAESLAVLATLRVFAAAFEIVAIQASVVLAVESASPGRRALAAGAMSVAAGMGIGAVTLLYPLLAPNWRALYWLGGLGIPAAPLIWRFLPESAAWLRGRAGISASALSVCLRPPWRRRLAIVTATALLGSLFGSPAGLFVALYASRDLHMSPAAISAVIVASGLAGAAAYVAGGWISDRAGRRLPGVAMAAGSNLLGGVAFAGGVPGFWAGNVLGSAVASASGPLFGAWYAEIFPTRARVTAQAVAGVAGAAGGIAGLQAVAALSPRLGLGLAILAMVVPALVSAGLLLLLPETRGAPLPE